MRLLLVEDDAPLARGLSGSLRLGGYSVDWVQKGALANSALAVEAYDAVILDLNLPDVDGLVMLKQWRGDGIKVPVLILSARDEIQVRVKGLDLGADDYLVKPFDLAELEARLRVMIRRTQAAPLDTLIQIGPLQIDLAQRRAQLHGHDMALSTKEFAMMQSLAMKCGQLVPKEQLMSRLSDFHQDMSVNALDILVHRLRKKFEGSGLAIRTMRGFGYVLEEQQQAS